MFKKSMRLILVLIFFISICSSVIPVYAWDVNLEGTATNIVDGDTFDIDNGERIRLADISAPEPSDPGGSQATSILTSLINGKTVYLDTDPDKSYGRWVAVVYVKHSYTHYKNINKVLWDNYQPPFYDDDHSNEFNPSTWTLYVRYNYEPTAVVNGPSSSEVGVSISFSSAGSSDSDGAIEEYYWTFDDGDSSTSENPTHTYQSGGTYTVTLRVTDDDGATDTATSLCSISSPAQPPIPTPPLPPILSKLTITPAEIERGDNVTIGLDIMNIDSQSFTYIVTMQVGELTMLVDVELGAYESKTVKRTITPDMVGDFNVTVDGLTGSFTVKAPPKPAEFEFSNLRIFYPGVMSPVGPGQTVTVTISIEAENVGELEGNHTVELRVDEEVVDSKGVTLEGGASATVLFELTRGEGTHEVEVERFTESFTVNPKPSFWDKIPGFPYESIILGLVTGIFVLWLLSRRKMTL